MKTESSKNEFDQIKDFVLLCLKHWYYFVISMFICGCIGILYFIFATPVKRVVATVNIRHDESLVNSSGQSTALANAFGLSSGSENVEDETLKLGSHGNIKKVVKKLDLNKFYTQSEYFGFKKTNLYDSSPIILSAAPMLSDTISSSIKFSINYSENKMIVKMKRGFKTIGKYELNSLPAMIDTPLGQFSFSKSPSFDNYELPLSINILLGNYDSMSQLWQREIIVDFEKKTSDLMYLATESENPRLAKQILNELINAYNQDWHSDRSMVTSETITYLEKRLNIVLDDLDTADKNIELFKEKNNLTDIASDISYRMSSNALLESRIMDIQNELDLLDLTIEFISNDKYKFSLIPYDLSLATSLIGMIETYNRFIMEWFEAKLDESRKRLEIQINAQRENLLKSLLNFKEGTEVTLNNIKTKETINAEVIASSPSLEQEFLSLRRTQDRYQRVLALILGMKEETELKAVLLMPKLKFIDDPYILNKSVSPNLMKTAMMILFFGGIVFPFAAIYGIPYFRNRRNKE